MDSAVDRRGRILGMLLIAALWLVAGYLVLYYSALYRYGAQGLFEALGQDLYNSWIPGGGFTLFGFIATVALIWALPVGVFFAASWWVSRLVLPALELKRRRLAVGVAAVALTSVMHLASFDSWPWMLASLINDTEFAEDYTAPGFWRVTPGMTEEDVLDELGEPLWRQRGESFGGQWGFNKSFLKANEQYLSWSRSRLVDGPYRVRALLLRDGVVVAKASEYLGDS